MGLAVLALRLCRLHGGRLLATVHQLLEPFGAEPGYEVVPVSDHGNSDPTAQRAPLPQGVNVLCDVKLLELTTVFLEPILGKFAIRSRRGGVNSDLGHNGLLAGVDVGPPVPREDAAESRSSRAFAL